MSLLEAASNSRGFQRGRLCIFFRVQKLLKMARDFFWWHMDTNDIAHGSRKSQWEGLSWPERGTLCRIFKFVSKLSLWTLARACRSFARQFFIDLQCIWVGWFVRILAEPKIAQNDLNSFLQAYGYIWYMPWVRKKSMGRSILTWERHLV